MKKKIILFLSLLLVILFVCIGIKLCIDRVPSYPPRINHTLLRNGTIIDAHFVNLGVHRPTSVGEVAEFSDQVWVLRSVAEKDAFLSQEIDFDSELPELLDHSEEEFQKLNIVVIIFPFSPVSEESLCVDAVDETEAGQLRVNVTYTDIGTGYDTYMAAYCLILKIPPTELSSDQIMINVNWKLAYNPYE